ncbi:MAG: PD-(D/E)XK nuclease family protein [Anaerolineae bacterium]|nr:PD-(D/E)XK nuclease family protein [Anaerolineae bacterium]
MPLPQSFPFSQSSLHDFETCPRRFKLRYLDRLRWPAVEAEPIVEAERLARLGQDFHRLVQQHLIGLEVETLTAYLTSAEDELRTWWQRYLAHRPEALATATLHPELTLSAPLRDYRLLARFDLLAVLPDGQFLIIDWKTSRQKPQREHLARRVQTRVYPYVLAQAGAAFNQGQPIDPAAIKMIYWYAQFPDAPEQFDYSAQLFQRDEQFLSQLVEQIKHSDFPLVESHQPCHHCVYRSYCNRGDSAGPLTELPPEAEPEAELDVLALDWEQIAEIQF